VPTFNERFKEVVTGIPESTVCEILKISKFTFKRWVAGKSAPHPFGHRSVFESIDKYKQE